MSVFFFFFFNATATTEIYTLSLHDALPIYTLGYTYSVTAVPTDTDYTAARAEIHEQRLMYAVDDILAHSPEDRKSTRLNSSHMSISYAVFCLKKKKKKHIT